MSQSHQRHVFAVYDISSSSVAGAHALPARDENVKTILLANVREDAPLQEVVDIDRLVHDTVSHLESVISRVRKADVHHPSFIQVVLASPWYRSQTHTILYKKDIAFVCTQKLVDSLIATEIKNILTQETGPFGAFGTESIIIEKHLSAIKLNGYQTNAPYGKRAVTMEFSLMLTIAPKTVIDLFSDTLKRAYGPRTIRYTTSPFATYIVMRDRVTSAKEDCVVIDVGEEVTDIAFVKGGTLLFQHSYPVGAYGLYRTLVEQGMHTISESMALLESFRLHKLSAGASVTAQKAIVLHTEVWRKGFQHMLEEGKHGFCMPGQVIITADSRFEKIYTDAIATDPFVIHQCVAAAVTPLFIGESGLSTYVGTADHTGLDIPLSVGALFVECLVY